MKKLALFGSDIDDVVSNFAFLLLALVATLAALDIFSPWVVFAFWVFYVSAGLIMACLLPDERESQDHELKGKQLPGASH